MVPLEELTLECLTERLVLGTAHGAQILALIKLSNMKHGAEGCEIVITDRIKTSRLETYQPLLLLLYFLENPKIMYCIDTGHLYPKDIRMKKGNRQVNFNKKKKKTIRTISAVIGKWIKTAILCLAVT